MWHFSAQHEMQEESRTEYCCPLAGAWKKKFCIFMWVHGCQRLDMLEKR